MIRWILTCEHGGHRVPVRWRELFVGAENVLQSHRGWDRGALSTYKTLVPEIADAAFHSTTTRLLVDLNRSLHHRSLFSEFTRVLPESQRREIILQHYLPYRERVADTIAKWRQADDTVIHLSIHSFTPVMDGHVRNADVGLLYDPGRELERTVCRQWCGRLKAVAPGCRVRLNYPYRGTADGLTKWLRQQHPAGYAGIELELNEGNVGRRCSEVAAYVLDSLAGLRADLSDSSHSGK